MKVAITDAPTASEKLVASFEGFDELLVSHDRVRARGVVAASEAIPF
jgi:hypothetical protein